MITRIQDELVGESIAVPQIKLAIQTAISSYENTAFYFNQKVGTFPTVSGREYYGVADLADIPNMIKVYSANVSVSGMKQALNPVDFNEIDEQQTGSVTGTPYVYASFQQQLRLYPIPNAVFTVQMSYINKFAALSADGSTNAWMDDGEELIRQSAKRRLALDVFYSDKAAARAKVLEDEAFDGLRQETKQRLPNMQLRSPAFPISRSSFDINRG
jgi:hypothetical protein